MADHALRAPERAEYEERAEYDFLFSASLDAAACNRRQVELTASDSPIWRFG
ncbi:hypothetical protein [Acidomonas methanolica]|uniref:hypothetical protein n=1 Tax=Acidomonas methanolica TaxID=437 RepID=UPI00130D4B9A|nr:hypothetical protein [Acidomonas methanolica]MBU2655638.1 hypothetical protein [Acidomonas methanolica]